MTEAVNLLGMELIVVSVPTQAVDLGRLTAAERAVLVLLLRHGRAVDVARNRERSLRTVRHQLESIYRKLGVRSRAELTALCGAERM